MSIQYSRYTFTIINISNYNILPHLFQYIYPNLTLPLVKYNIIIFHIMIYKQVGMYYFFHI